MEVFGDQPVSLTPFHSLSLPPSLHPSNPGSYSNEIESVSSFYYLIRFHAYISVLLFLLSHYNYLSSSLCRFHYGLIVTSWSFTLSSFSRPFSSRISHQIWTDPCIPPLRPFFSLIRYIHSFPSFFTVHRRRPTSLSLSFSLWKKDEKGNNKQFNFSGEKISSFSLHFRENQSDLEMDDR